MKKLLALILAAALALSMTACGGKSGAEDTKTPRSENEDVENISAPEETSEPIGAEDNTPEETSEPAVKKDTYYQLGDTVSTDIIELTVKKASLSYYAVGMTRDTVTHEIVNIESAYEPPEDDTVFCYYSCNKGRVLVCLDFVITNTDRALLNTNDYLFSFGLKQNDNLSDVNSYALNEPDGNPFGFEYDQCGVAKNGGYFIHNISSNLLFDAGSSYEIKQVGVASFEADLSAPYELIVGVADSSGNYKLFTYSVE